MNNNERMLVKIIREICDENAIKFKSYSYDWILELSANGSSMFIYGYKFPNNNTAISRICDDKSGLSDILSNHEIPHVEHYYFMSPNNSKYVPANGNYETILSLLKKYGEIVCKPNSGTCGIGVERVKNKKDLEKVIFNLFTRSNSISIAPYKPISSEFRVIVINYNIELIFEKVRPVIIGDGIHSIQQLIDEYQPGFKAAIDSNLSLDDIPQKEEIITISWKHNLCNGALPKEVDDISLKDKISELAISCVLALDLNFASIDIINTNGQLEILEVNSGVMMENLSCANPEYYNVAKNIYRKAIFNYLKMDDIKYQYLNQRQKKKHFVLPVLTDIAREKSIDVMEDKEEGNFSVFIFKNGKRFIAKDYPFNINSAGSISLCQNKYACSVFLKEMGYKVPLQRYFVKKYDSEITINEVKKYLSAPVKYLGFDYPLIIKPNSLSQGVGVHKVDNMSEGVMAVKQILNIREKIYLLQEYLTGHDYRIVVLGNEVIQAYERMPFQIIGDGIHSIKELINNRINDFYINNRDKLIDPNDSRISTKVLKQGYTYDYILDVDKICALQDISNLSLGGTTVNKIDEISTFYKNLSIGIAHNLNLKLCGIDIIASDISDNGNGDYTILEINSAPGLDNYLYDGEKQDIYVRSMYEKVFRYMELN